MTRKKYQIELNTENDSFWLTEYGFLGFDNRPKNFKNKRDAIGEFHEINHDFTDEEGFDLICDANVCVVEVCEKIDSKGNCIDDTVSVIAQKKYY